jgi:hypothetical protein
MVPKDMNGLEKYSHEEKVAIIWEAFKDRLGASIFSQIHYNLSELLSPVIDLEHLVNPFTIEEIDRIVEHLPSDKSPSPDGFNTHFMKKC